MSGARQPRGTAAAGPLAMMTVFAANGAILLQNAAATRLFAAGPAADGRRSALARHFVEPAAGRRLLDAARGGKTVCGEASVHTAAGLRRHRFEASPAAGPRGARRLVLNEWPADATSRHTVPAPAATPAAPASLSPEGITNALLGGTLDALEQGIMVVDPADNLVLWNRSARTLLQVPDAMLRLGAKGMDFVRFYAARGDYGPGTADELAARQARRLRRDGQIVLDRRAPDGRALMYRCTNLPDGSTVHSYTDVTQLKRNERDLADKSALLAATLDNMDQGLLFIDRARRLQLWNNRLAEMFDLAPGLLAPDRRFDDFVRHFIVTAGVPAERVERTLALRLRAFRKEQLTIIDRRRADGLVVERRWRATPEGGAVITYTDITARHQAQEELLRAKDEAELANRSKTEFLATMSHELRTPLNAVIGFSEMMLSECFGPLGHARYLEYARDMRESGRHLLNLINDVLDVSKIEAGGIELAEETVDLGTVLEACDRLVRHRAEEGGVQLEINPPRDTLLLRADGRRLKQILLNLLSNAVKFTTHGGQVTVGCVSGPQGLDIVVRDTGIGIEAEDIGTALRPFGQIDSRIARKYQGTGLGLPLSKSMVELHGGQLVLDSAPGRGTTVTVRLPAERIIRAADAARGR